MAFNISLALNTALVILSIYFGVQAVFMFKKTRFSEMIKTLGNLERHRYNLLYSTIFLGSTLIALSVYQGARYISGFIITCAEFIALSCSDLIILSVNLSFLAITYTWYAFMREVTRY